MDIKTFNSKLTISSCESKLGHYNDLGSAQWSKVMAKSQSRPNDLKFLSDIDLDDVNKHTKNYVNPMIGFRLTEDQSSIF